MKVKVVTGVKAMFVAVVAAAGLMAFAEGDISITLDRVQQRYPWNGMVDIDYTVSKVDVPANYYVRFTLTDDKNQPHVLHEFLDFGTLYEASNGTYRVTWNSAAEDSEGREYPEYRILATNAQLRAEIVRYGSDKWHQPYGDRYVVIDLSGGSTATEYPIETRYYRTMAEATNVFNKATYKTTKLVLRRVRAGEFSMGSNETVHATAAFLNKETKHQVKLTKNFLLGMFEVTSKQYYLVMGKNPSAMAGKVTGGNSCPVDCVSYRMARGESIGCTVPPTFGNVNEDSFMGKISQKTGLKFDLPTEAQWEYACRASTIGATYIGANTASNVKKIGWYSGNASTTHAVGGTTHAVGGKQPNKWGFYDMIGNVWELTRDRVKVAPNDYYGYAKASAILPLSIDPVCAVSNGRVSVRGGGWDVDEDYQRSAIREGLTTIDRENSTGDQPAHSIGFRLSRTLATEDAPSEPSSAVVGAEGGDDEAIASNSTICKLDTRAQTVYRPKSSVELFPFAWNTEKTWPKDGQEMDSATITWTEMEGANPDDPTTWKNREGGDSTTATGNGEGTTNWGNYVLHKYKATLSQNGSTTETAYFDLSKMAVLGETFAICDHADGGANAVNLLVELGTPLWEKLVQGLIDDERLTVVCASTQEGLDTAATSCRITYSTLNTPELLATGKCWVTIDTSSLSGDSVSQRLWRFVFK